MGYESPHGKGIWCLNIGEAWLYTTASDAEKDAWKVYCPLTCALLHQEDL
jgi:hypothetical protein